MPWRKTLCSRLPAPIAAELTNMPFHLAQKLTEIRVRLGQPVFWVFTDSVQTTGNAASVESIGELVSALCGYSRYAFELQIAQGYIALPGGHRAGVCGRVVYENGEIARMSAIHSVCVRIARRVSDASASLRGHFLLGGRPARVLLLGPPGCGKTTALRDAALYLSTECRFHVAAADEREELFPAANDAPIDILSGARKADALSMLTRSMAPDVLVADEIGSMEDACALLDAASCGVGVLASAHAAGIEDVLKRPALRLLFERRALDRYVLLGKLCACLGVWDGEGRSLMEENHGEL